MHFPFQVPKAVTKKNHGVAELVFKLFEPQAKIGVWIILWKCCHGNCWWRNNTYFWITNGYILQPCKSVQLALVSLFVIFFQSYKPSKRWKLVPATLTCTASAFLQTVSSDCHEFTWSFEFNDCSEAITKISLKSRHV